MTDLLYRTSIYGPKRTVAVLPWGDEIVRGTELTYQFYNIEQGVDSAMRTARAAARIRKSHIWHHELKDQQAERLINDLLLGLVPGVNAKDAVKKGEATVHVKQALSEGVLDAAVPRILDEKILPFRESPLSGKTLKEITGNPTAIAVFVVITTKTSAPIAFIVLPVGIVAMHVALKAGPRLANWVDNKMRRWLK